MPSACFSKQDKQGGEEKSMRRQCRYRRYGIRMSSRGAAAAEG